MCGQTDSGVETVLRSLLAAPYGGPVVSSAARVGGPAAASTTALFVKREGRRGPGYKGGSGGGSGGGGGAGGYRGGRPGGRRRDAGAEPSKDPEKRLANLNRKLTSIIEVCAKGGSGDWLCPASSIGIPRLYLLHPIENSRLHHPKKQLEQLPWDELNEEQRQKVERKGDVQAEISRLTNLVRQVDFM